MNRLFLFLLFLYQFTFSAHVITWIPPYSTGTCVNNLYNDYDGYGPKDGISHLALQFWTPNGSGGVEYVNKDGYSVEYLCDDSVKVIRNWTHKYDIKLMLCLYNGVYGWDWSLATSAFKTYRDKTVKSLLSIVDNLSLDGVELDLEATGVASDADRNAYVEFTKVLGDSLRSRGKDLTLASFSYEWNSPNWDWWNDLVPNVTAITSMGYQEIGSTGSDWSYYGSQKAKISIPSKLMLGVPDNYNSWKSATLTEHLKWIRDDGVVGVGLWDMELRSSAIKTKEAWQLLNQIRGDLVKKFTITATSNPGGMISPSGNVSVDSTSDKKFAITADKWFVIDYIKIDGIKIDAATSYTFTNVVTDHSIEVFFIKDSTAPDLYTITANADTNGSITPQGYITAESGSSKSFSIKALTGYHSESVMIDGIDRGPIVDITFKNIFADHSIKVSFAKSKGGDLGKYQEWYSSIAVPYGDTVFYNDTLWIYQGSQVTGGWGSNMQPTKALEEQFGIPPWLYAKLYNGVADTTITASAVYNSSPSKKDTLIITTTYKAMDITYKTTVDTIFVATPIFLNSHKNTLPSSIVIKNDRSFFAPKSDVYNYSVFDARGKKVLSKNILVRKAGFVDPFINTNNLSNGVFIISVKNSVQQTSSRVIYRK